MESFVIRSEPAGWLRLIWNALHHYRETAIPEGGGSANDREWDEITTAMAWIGEELGVDAEEVA